MDISAALTADLADLGQDLEPAGNDLADSVRSLRRDATLAVRSLLGLTLTVVIRNEPVTLTSIDEWVEPSDIRSALEISLPSVAPSDSSGLMTLYAEKANAFDQFADDLAREVAAGDFAGTKIDGIEIRTDTSLPSTFGSGLTGITELLSINRAVGVLIARGHSHDSALEYLSERVRPGRDRHQVAAEILRTARGG